MHCKNKKKCLTLIKNKLKDFNLLFFLVFLSNKVHLLSVTVTQ